MKRSLLEIYALSVCFVTVISVSVLSGYALYNVVQVAAPEVTLGGYEYNAAQSNAAFRRTYHFNSKTDSALSDEEITKRRQDAYAKALSRERRVGGQALLRQAIFILVGVVVFALHWKIAKRARQSVNT